MSTPPDILRVTEELWAGMSMQANPDNLNQNTSGQEQNRLAKHQSKETKEQHFEKMFLQT